MPAKKTTKIVATSQPVQPKKYELINKRAAPIAINCISTVLQVPGGVSGKVIVTEEQLELQDIQFLLGRGWIEAVEHKPVDKSKTAKFAITKAKVKETPPVAAKPSFTPINDQKGSEVTIRYAGQTLKRHMSSDATLQPGPNENLGPTIIDTDADQKID